MIGAAVHRSRPLSAEGLRERLFTLAFSNLVYAQIWEDPAVDLEALALDSDSRIVTIASGGCNVLSYLTAGPAHVAAVDINAAHVALNRLKLAAARHLPDYHAFYRFFGAANSRRISKRSSTTSCLISMRRRQATGWDAMDCAAAAASSGSPATFIARDFSAPSSERATSSPG